MQFRSVLMGVVAVTGLQAAMPAQSETGGERLFKQKCALCHVVKPGAKSSIGPNLFGLSTRPAGSLPGFQYSKALSASKLVWTPASLDKFVAAPNKIVAGTMMVVSVPDPKARAAIVTYLLTLK